jgi:death-on-curing protein
MRYLTVGEVLDLHQLIILLTGGSEGVRDANAIDSAVAQPQMTFGGRELYPTIEEKSSALAFSLIKNHPFMDGNKRIGFAALEVFLTLNRYELSVAVDDAETTIAGVASGAVTRDQLTQWNS